MPISETKLKSLLQKAFPDGEVLCNDLAGDNDHWEVTVIDKKFEGKNLIQQHKMVQEAVKNHEIHALSIKTKKPL